MSALLYVLSSVVSMLIGIILFLMLVRALLSWFPLLDEDSTVAELLFITTEPFVLPVRALLDRFEVIRSLPIDISYMITMLLLGILRTIL